MNSNTFPDVHRTSRRGARGAEIAKPVTFRKKEQLLKSIVQWLVIVLVAINASGSNLNPHDRAHVRAFFNAAYHVSDDVPMASTADVAACFPGTNSLAFRQSVLWRINWFRAMAGVPATIVLDDAFTQDAQMAALMISAQGERSHLPPSTWICWSMAGSNAAFNANLVLDTAGAEAITRYMDDFGAENGAVGHRRWLLYPQTQRMGTGDVPGQGGRPPANATWVLDENLGGSRPPTRQPEVTWPPAGYVPYPVVFRRWSFSYSGASFASAGVSMLRGGTPIAVTKEPLLNGFGENTIVWVPAGLDPVPGGYQWPRPPMDTTYTVALTNVLVRGRFSNFTYTVTVFDPEQAGANEPSPTLTGPSDPFVGQGTAYAVETVPWATRHEWRASRKLPLAFHDDAERGLSQFTVSTSPGYAVVRTGAGAGGSQAFHLAHPEPVSRQSLRLNLRLTPHTNCILSFKSRLGRAGDGQFARVQVSLDEGASWVDVYAQAGSGGAGETTFHPRQVALGDYVGRSLVLRFTYDFFQGGFFALTNLAAGWLLDDIAISNGWALVETDNGMVEAGNFAFHPAEPGAYWLEARGFINDIFGLPWGPGLNVDPIPPLALVAPRWVAGQLQIRFTPGRAGPADVRLERASTVLGPWLLDEEAVLQIIEGQGQFMTQPAGTTYYRLASP